MDLKALFGYAVIPAAILGAILVASLSKRIRDTFFVLMVFLAPLVQRLDLNFVSREWYRGSSRGFEVSVVGIMALGVLMGSILVPRRGESRMYWVPSLGIMLVYALYCVFNVSVSSPQLFGWFEILKVGWGFVFFLAAAFYVRSEREVRLFILALGLAVCFQALLGIKQRYLGGIYRVYGTLDDSNSLSLFFCTTAPVFVAAVNSTLSRGLKPLCVAAIALAGVCEILTLSRAGVVTIAAVLVGAALATMSFKFTARQIAICLLVVLAATAVGVKARKTLMARFAEATLKDEYENKRTLGRGYYIRIAKLIAREEPLGVGLNNWSYWVSKKYGPKLGHHFTPYPGTDRPPSLKVVEGANVDEPQAAPAHSLGALTLGELGIPGLVLLSFVWLRWLQMGFSFLWQRSPLPMKRLAVGIFFGFCGCFLQSLTEWVFRQTPIYLLFHLMLGVLASLYYVKKRERRAGQSAAQPEPLLGQPIQPQVIT